MHSIYKTKSLAQSRALDLLAFGAMCLSYAVFALACLTS